VVLLHAGYFVKGDFCFKPCKRVRVIGGEKAYEATLVIVNEWMEVPAWYACQSTSFEDMKEPLCALFKRMMQLNAPDDFGAGMKVSSVAGRMPTCLTGFSGTADLLHNVVHVVEPWWLWLPCVR
jgi:hypothetical protein